MDERKSRVWAEISLAALRHNVDYLRALLPAGCRLMPALKANAYGHGAVPIARELMRLGVREFCVATADEGAELRRAGIGGDILILGYTHEGKLSAVNEYNLIQCVVDADYLKMLLCQSLPLRVELGVDTGMHRLGIDWRDSAAPPLLCGQNKLKLEGAFTHICTGDEEFSAQQKRRFEGFTNAVSLAGIELKRRHLMSSQSLLTMPWLGGDLARVGIALYGLMSRRGDAPEHEGRLKPVLTLKTRVASLRDISAGEGAGYGLGYRAEHDGRLATLPIGYGDGLPSCAAGRARVLINGQPAPIVGRICMDQCLVDATNIDCKRGDEVVLIGRSGGAEISAYELSESCGMITNELLSRLGPRVERIVM